MKFSFSALTKFKECGYLYRLFYIDRLRSLEEPSSLTFGSALDKAFGAMLIPGPKTPEQVFDEEWSEAKILTGNEKFSKADLDLDLLTPDEQSLSSVHEQSFISLSRKGHIMLQALRTKLMPQIESVLAVQEPISLDNQNESGDTFIGFIDLVVRLKGVDKPVIADLKTTSVKYADDSVKKSPQLGIYTYTAGVKFQTNLAAFFTVSKKIDKTRYQTCTVCGHKDVDNRAKTCTAGTKRCGGAWDVRLEFDSDVTIVMDEITLTEEEQVLELIDSAYAEIQAGVFEKNPKYCIHPIFRKKCVFWSLCHEGKMDGLVKKD